jgi:RNA polymerase sigma-70 factor (ECF subfamily)
VNDTSINSDKQLFDQLAAGDESAFRKLFDAYREMLFIFAFQLTHSKVDAEEILQDIFLKLWENREKLRQVDNPKNYLFIMARNRTLDLLTKISKDQKLMKQVWANITQQGSPVEEIIEAKESQKLINEALSRLSERKQAIFNLSRKGGLSHEQIADQLGISVQTVKNTITEVLRFIKDYLSGHSELLAVLFWLHYFGLLF